MSAGGKLLQLIQLGRGEGNRNVVRAHDILYCFLIIDLARKQSGIIKLLERDIIRKK